jgi:hypothetical protein
VIVVEESLITLDQIVEQALAEGYGTPEALRSHFFKLRAYGLIGRPIEKEHRRGGAGLWHPVQGSLFIFYLGNRREGISLTDLSNAPVGLWLLDGADGPWRIDTRQAQQALLYGGSSMLREKVGEPWQYGVISKRGRPGREIGERSIQAQNARRTAQIISRPRSTPHRAISKVLSSVAMDAPDFNLKKSQFIEAFRAARPQVQSPLAEAEASALYQIIADRHLAIRHVKALTREVKPVLELWEWARSFWQLHTAYYMESLPKLQVLPGMGDLFEQTSLQQIMTFGSTYLLGVLGGAIRGLQGDVYPSIQQFGLPRVSLEEIGVVKR